MRTDFEKADFAALEACWNGFFPERYRVDAAQIRANTVGSPLFDWGASLVDQGSSGVLGFAIVKKSAKPKAAMAQAQQSVERDIAGLRKK